MGGESADAGRLLLPKPSRKAITMSIKRIGAPRVTIAGLILALLASWLFFSLTGGGVAAASAPQAAAAPAASSVSQVLFINLQSGREDLHRVNMAFQMARNQRKAGRPVTMFFNIDAPELATKNLPSALRWRSNPPIKDQVRELIGLGVTVLVCPSCSADQGVTAADLVVGAKMSNPTLLAGHIRPGTVSMTY